MTAALATYRLGVTYTALLMTDGDQPSIYAVYRVPRPGVRPIRSLNLHRAVCLAEIRMPEEVRAKVQEDRPRTAVLDAWLYEQSKRFATAAYPAFTFSASR